MKLVYRVSLGDIGTSTMLQRLKDWARAIERDVLAVWIASRDPRVPWYAKAVAIFVAAYALSPIDLIPDFIPVIGYLDDLIIVPLGILLTIKLIPPELMKEFREEATRIEDRPKSYLGATFIVLMWIVAIILILWLFWPRAAG